MSNDLAATFSARLLQQIARRDLSNAELARAINVSIAYIGQMCKPERGKLPSADVLVQLAATLHTSCDYLLGRTDDPSPPTREQLRLPRPQVEAALDEITSAAEHLRSALFGQIESQAEHSGKRFPPDGDAVARGALQDLAMPTPAEVARQSGSARARTQGRRRKANGSDSSSPSSWD
jgi:transcriptional regulator with XRE-family HTH domain